MTRGKTINASGASGLRGPVPASAFKLIHAERAESYPRGRVERRAPRRAAPGLEGQMRGQQRETRGPRGEPPEETHRSRRGNPSELGERDADREIGGADDGGRQEPSALFRFAIHRWIDDDQSNATPEISAPSAPIRARGRGKC